MFCSNPNLVILKTVNQQLDINMKAFSEEWVAAFTERINSNNEYAAYAKEWNWSIVLSMIEEGNEKNVFLDLQKGKCANARIASTQDINTAEFIISASSENWQKILTGNLDPIMAVMIKKLELTKGNVGLLLQNVDSAKELLKSASQIPIEF